MANVTPERCPSCQRQLLSKAEFCHHCGARLTQSNAPIPPRPLPKAEVEEDGRIRCPRCQTRNRPGSAHCRACAAPIRWQNVNRPGELVSETGERIGKLAGFWIRLAAYLVDSLVLLVPGFFIVYYFGTDPSVAGISQAQFVNFAVGTFYVVVGWSTFGTTLGKRIFNLYVVRPDGSMPGAARALYRQLATIVSVLMLFLGYIMIAVRPDKRASHDIIADTYVIIRDPRQ